MSEGMRMAGALRVYDEFVAFVAENYGRKVVEVGVGHRHDVAEKLKRRLPEVEVIVTDTQESIINLYIGRNVRAIVDDVFHPTIEIYQDASLIYSLNPPTEFIPALERLAVSVGANLLVKPVSDEQDMFSGPNWVRVVVRGHTMAWLFRSSALY